MIASQLGAVMSDGFDKRTAITHCKTYREVAKDGTVYDNWRLPTNEEVKVICTYQFDSNSPIVRCSAASTCLLEQERAKMKHIYTVRATPTLMLIGRGGLVELKDPTPEQLLSHLER